jgi:hypothetical protein
VVGKSLGYTSFMVDTDWIVEAVRVIAQRVAEAEADRGGNRVSGKPIVEVSVAGDRVKFVYDYMIHFSTISGSDWYHHHVVTGEARIHGRELTEVDAVERLDANVTEHEMEWAEPPYDRRAAIQKVKSAHGY